MASDNEQIVRQAYQAAEEMDMAGWVASFTEDGTFTDNSIGVTWKGPAELPQQVENYHRAFPDMHRELLRFYTDGDIVVVQLALQGTHSGPLHLPAGTLPPTGKRIDAPCCDVLRRPRRSLLPHLSRSVSRDSRTLGLTKASDFRNAGSPARRAAGMRSQLVGIHDRSR